MRFTAFRLRAILVPLGVALMSVAAVAWYDLVKIPSQQRYITDRNLRLLKTKSAQIKSKVDNFGVSIDNALHFYPESHDSAKYTDELQRYMRKFASSVEILSDRESRSSNTANRKQVVVQRDAGRSFLYLEYRHGDRVVVAKSDIELAVAPFLNSGSEFDALLLAMADGTVIAQHSTLGLDLTHLDGLLESAPPPVKSAGDANDKPAPSLFERLRKSTNVENVTVGNAEYQMYVQPVQLSLTTADGEADGVVEWALCGLVRGDHFRAAGSAISYTYLVWFVVALAIVVLAIPLLKLHMLSSNERLRGIDAVSVAVTTFLATGLVTFCGIDAYFFHVEVNARTRRDLGNVAAEMSAHVRAETAAIEAQMRDFREPGLWTKLGYDRLVESGAAGTKELTLDLVAPNAHPATIRIEDDRYSCAPDWACVDNVLFDPRFDTRHYPYFDSVMWLDQTGWQRIKWSAGRVTPLLSVSQLPYFQQLMASRIVPRTAGNGSGVAVIQSRNTGEVLTIFWHALRSGYDSKKAHLAGQAMLVTPMSLVYPVLPGRTQFAVVDNTGRVLFHSDATRSLRENFFVECEDNPDLRSAVSGRRSMYLNASYLARSYSMFVTPLELSSFGDPGWSLVVFEDRSAMETVNIETLTAAVLLFAVYGGLLAIGWAVLFALAPESVQKWFWPEPSARGAYRAVIIINAALGVLFFGGVARLESTRLLGATALLVAFSVLSTYLLVTRERRSNQDDAPWETSFHLARVSFLFIVAAIPAIAFFVAAYNFEMALVDTHGQAALATKLKARTGRINARAIKFPLCDAKEKPKECPSAIDEFITKRAAAGESGRPWDVAAPGVHATAASDVPAITRLDAILAWVHRPFNDVAVELAAVLPLRHIEQVGAARHRGAQRTVSADALHARVTGPVWMVAAGILGLLFVLVRFVVRPLYLFELYRTTHGHTANVNDSTHTLLVGPPGAGKSARLAKKKDIRIFDASTRAWVEQRVAVLPVPVERRRSVFAPLGLIRFQFTDREPEPLASIKSDLCEAWLDVSQLPGDPNAPVGIDHLERGLDNHEDRLKLLRLLEWLLYEQKRTVHVAAARDPIAQLRDMDDDRPAAGEMSRWIRVLRSFSEKEVALGTCDIGERHARAIWSSCSKSEQLALRQLADEDVVNPHSEQVVGRLMRLGLVRRDRRLYITNAPFQEFVTRAMTADEVSRREGEGVSLPWASKATAGVTVAIGIAMALVLTSQQMVDAWIGYMPALAPAVPTMLKLLGAVRDPKSAAADV